ncbi:transposase [Salinigranum marinum]|uniref:transposase n=1 Tax=Salinigranum marinum TaxID=1515595 RepID=UPI002989B9A4|nr:transposase [Salinigranum marinum]
MTEDSSLPRDRLAEFVTEIGEQTEDLCHIHDHITRVIANLDIDDDWFSDYDDPDRAKFDLDAVVQMFLYQHARGFNQSELERRLKGAAYVYIRFGLGSPLSQQIISHNWRNRFCHSERQAIETVAEQIRKVCADNDIIDTGEPALEPSDVNAKHGIGEEQIMDAVERATELGFTEFSADRASNAKYPLEAFFERQGYLNMAKAGTTTLRRRFARLSDRSEVPHGSTHNRTMKKVASPDSQTILVDYEDGQRPLDWKRIRDAILPAFHAGVEKQLDEIAGRDRQGLREPLMAAIDITTFNFWPSPFRNEKEVAWDEEPVVSESGREVYPKEDYPEMVSGFKPSNKEKAERGYKFATLSIVAEETPIILAIEPVRDERWWEKADANVDVERTPRVDIVNRLMEQATRHVDIHKVFCDREFDVHGIRDALDRGSVQYVIGKQERSNSDAINIKEIKEDTVYDTRIEHAELWHEGRMHKVSIIYKSGGEYSLFTVNGWVDEHRAEALISQYRHRWTIENEYKDIKAHFLPQTATKDYRIRFLYFVIGVILHNVWRLANFVLRDEIDVHLGESPPLRAGEIVELVGFCLFDPGG